MILKRLSWLLLLVAAPLLAQDRPLPPDEVFKYAVFDAGDALEVDWFVDDGAYMYRKAFNFTSGDSAITFGDVEYPDGEIHSDEFLGEQEIYRGSFLVRIPYTVNGSKPAKVPLTIDSRGCLDSGFCYAPTTWIETVSLKSASAPQKLDFSSLGNTAQSDFPPPEEVFFPDVFVVDGNTVEVGIRIEPEYYVYRDKISVAVKSGPARATSLELPDGKMKTDQFFGEQEVYYLEAVGRVQVARGTTEATTVEFELGYQGCAEGGLCYLPLKEVIAVELPAVDKVDDLSAYGVAAISDPTNPAGDSTSPGAATTSPQQSSTVNGAPVSEQGRLAGIITGSNLWIVVATFFGAGLLLAFTPCVLPMIPILSGIIAGDGDNVSPVRGFTLSLSYVMGMALVYTAAGIVAAAAGLQLQAAFNAPWVLIVFAGLFVVLAMSMFGMFELQMPSSIQSRLAAASGNQKSGTMVGAFVMGALSSLIVTACVAPPLVATLTVIGQTGDMLRGGLALFAMSLGMGAPLLLVGASAGQLLPKAGAWMEAVKGAFGFMMLALAIWMLSRFLPGEITLAMWAVLVFMAGVFLGGLTSLGTDSTAAQKLGKGFGTLGMIYGILLLLGSLTGGTNPLQPLASVNLGGGEAVKEEKLEFQVIKTVDDLDREVALAASQGKTAMLDFWAEWCVSCKEMEAFTFTDEEVQATLSGTVLLKADVTANDEADQALLARFGVFGPPTIIFFGPDGQQRHGYEVVGYMKAAAFSEHVRQAFAQPSAITAQVTE
ncbi:MAG: protein-disulfide reductase DsbD [Woeseiaceae bacterium]|nr:protein-disulfide reductase DsbD [Woeseiaceae bacterium]